MAPDSVIAIDGKVLRRSFDKASGKSPLHMVSAWGCDQRLVLAQVATDAKSNEITAVPKLLSLLSLKPLRSRVIRGQCMTMSRVFLDDPLTMPTMRHSTLIVFCVLMMGYGLWSLHVASCYQALCEISYWSASRAELKLCDERRGEFGL